MQIITLIQAAIRALSMISSNNFNHISIDNNVTQELFPSKSSACVSNLLFALASYANEPALCSII